MPQNQSQNIKSLKIVYAALMLGLILFTSIATYLYYINGNFIGEDPFFEKVLHAVSTSMAFISIPAGIVVFNKRIREIGKLEFNKKLEVYREAMVVRAACMEGSGFFFVICFILTGSSISFMEILAVLSIMFYFFPNNNRLAEELKHDLSEIEKLQNK